MNTEAQDEATKDIHIEIPVKRGRGRPVKPKEPKQPKAPKPIKHSLFLDDSKEWFRQYYNNKNPCECPTYVTKSVIVYSLTRHVGRNKACKLSKLEKFISYMSNLPKTKYLTC